MNHKPADIPKLKSLAPDLLQVQPWDRWFTLGRPFALAAASAALLATRHYVWAFVVLFLMYVAVAAAMHDLLHNSLRLSARLCDVLLFLVGSLILAPSHAFRRTHAVHHRAGPGSADPEVDFAYVQSLWTTLCAGPAYHPRLWNWAWEHRARRETVWLGLHAGVWLCALVAALLCVRSAPGVSMYVAFMMLGAWLSPLAVVYLPHFRQEGYGLYSAQTLRGWLPVVLMTNTYHLEHHLYPAVPGHHLPELAARLDPYFQTHAAGPYRETGTHKE